MATPQTSSQVLVAAALVGLCLTGLPVSCLADSVNPPMPNAQQRTKQLLPQKLSIEDYFPKKPMDYALPEPVNLDLFKVPGLTPAAMKMLGDNLFVVIDNTKFATMTDIYKDNRLRGKSNFVTADAIIHPYLVLHNEILEKVIEEHLAHDLSTLLKGMLKTALDDYNKADDSDVREDIERNMAFLAVAQRLLNPADLSELPDTAKMLVDKEFVNITSARVANSAVFDVKEDFLQYIPRGWYGRTPRLRNFFRCKQYLTRFSLELSEGKQESSNDPFRRSTLLFRCLDKAQIDGQPALALWRKINACWVLLGPQPYIAQKTLLPSDYSEILKSQSDDLKITLTKLAEPFFRTKLLLSVKKKRPVEISSSSIFDINQNKSTEEMQVGFRLLPLVEEPEQSWMTREGHSYSKSDPQIPPVPLALLDMHSHAITHATNVLAENVYKIDPNLTTMIPGLVQMMRRQPPAVVPDTWSILASYFKVPAETAPIALRTHQWMTHRLATGFAAWLDTQLACDQAASEGAAKNKTLTADIAPPRPGASKTSAAGSATTTTGAAESATTAGAPGSARPATRAVLHYLEPCPETFKAMKAAQQNLADKLDAIGYFPKSLVERNADFNQLLQKLTLIAAHQLAGQTQLNSDSRFLADIDTILEKISPATAGTLFFDSGPGGDTEPRTTTGATIGLGRPGMVFVIFFAGASKRFTLSRGAVFTQYEVAGGPITAQHWERDSEFGMMKPSFWTDAFEVVQQEPLGGIDADNK